MPNIDEAAETLSRCPRCQNELRSDPDPQCPLCDGSGMVSGKAAVVWNRFASTAEAASGDS